MASQAEAGTASDVVNTMTLVLGITNFRQDQEGFILSTDKQTRVQLPSELSTEDVQRMRRDFELLAAALRDHPTEMKNLLEAHFRKDVVSSRRIAETLGLSEESFKAQGGGIIWGVVAVVVVCDVLTGCFTGGLV